MISCWFQISSGVSFPGSSVFWLNSNCHFFLSLSIHMMFLFLITFDIAHSHEHVLMHVINKICDIFFLFKIFEKMNNQNAPRDHYKLAYIIFYWLGCASLLPWNFFTTGMYKIFLFNLYFLIMSYSPKRIVTILICILRPYLAIFLPPS